MELEVEMGYYKEVDNTYVNGARSSNGLLRRGRQYFLKWS